MRLQGVFSMSKLRLSLLLLLSFALALPAPAQVATAELSGHIVDASGAAVANAKVTATNTGTNRVFGSASNSTGDYVIPLLPPGNYTVTVEAPNFRKILQRGINLAINQQASLDFTLQVGQVSERSR